MSEHARSPRTVVAGVGFAAQACSDVVIELGAGHPTAHGLLRLRLELDGDRIVAAEPLVGHLHRGVEKLFEVRDYRQILALANRHDWHSSFAGELGIALVVEQMAGLQVPTRATWLRTLFAELTRIVHHLEFVDRVPLADESPLVGLDALRQELRDALEAATGGRLHVMVTRIGGLVADMPEGWFAQVAAAITHVREAAPRLTDALAADRVAGLRGVGVLDAATATAYGVLGVPSRAAGLDLDLRRDEPYLAYGELFGAGGPGRVVVREAGDVLARLEVLAEEIAVSADLVDACVARLRELPPEPVNVKLPKVLRVPEGSAYGVTEGPAGQAGYLLVSRGEKTPWRLAMRTPSFAAVSALPAVLAGASLADLAPTLASLLVVVGDVDR